MTLTSEQLQLTRMIMTNAGLVPGDGVKLSEVLAGATFQGRALSVKNETLLRKALATVGIKSPPKGPKRPGYREAVEYLALNDDTDVISQGGPTVCVSMIAHLFGKDQMDVVADVLDYRDKHNV